MEGLDIDMQVAPLTSSQIRSLIERRRVWALTIPTSLSGPAIQSALTMSTSCFRSLTSLTCELDVEAIVVLAPRLQHCSMYSITVREASQGAISIFKDACDLGSLRLWFEPDLERLETDAYSMPFVDPDELIILCEHQSALSSLSIVFKKLLASTISSSLSCHHSPSPAPCCARVCSCYLIYAISILSARSRVRTCRRMISSPPPKSGLD